MHSTYAHIHVSCLSTVDDEWHVLNKCFCVRVQNKCFVFVFNEICIICRRAIISAMTKEAQWYYPSRMWCVCVCPLHTVRNTLREIELQNDYCNGCGLTDHGCGMTLLSNELQIRTIGSIPGITGHN